MADGQGPRPFEPRPPIYERRRSAASQRYNECVRSAYEKVWRWSGGDWRIGRARKDQGTRGLGQPAELKRLLFILRVKGTLVKRYYRVVVGQFELIKALAFARAAASASWREPKLPSA
jgi:hypothetical protein